MYKNVLRDHKKTCFDLG